MLEEYLSIESIRICYLEFYITLYYMCGVIADIIWCHYHIELVPVLEFGVSLIVYAYDTLGLSLDIICSHFDAVVATVY